MELRDQLSLLLCTMKLLLYSPAARDCFCSLDGYSIFLRLIIMVITELGSATLFSSIDSKEDSTHSPGDNEDRHDWCCDMKGANVTTVLLSLIFGRHLHVDEVEGYGDLTFAEAVRHDLLVKNTYAIGIAVHLVNHLSESGSKEGREGENTIVTSGIEVLEIMLRLCPLSIISLESSGGLMALGRVIIKHSLIDAMFFLRSFSDTSACKDDASGGCAPFYGHPSFSVLQSASNVLVKVAVLNAEVNEHVLFFLTYVLHENALLQHRHLSPHTFLSHSSVHCPAPRCANCETEASVFECTDGSCICDEMFHLCVECDKVFHKSVLKRSHIRIPIVAGKGGFSTSALLESMGDDFRVVVEEQKKVSAGGKPTFDRGSRKLWCGADDEPLQEASAHSSCLLLSHVRSIVNDRQVMGCSCVIICLFCRVLL